MIEPKLTYLKPFMDSRGYSFFDIFKGINDGQINIGNLEPNVVKAFHYHKNQWDHWFCLKGDIRVICVSPDLTPYIEEDSEDFIYTFNDKVKSFYIGEHNPAVLSIPRLWWHGYTNISQVTSTLLYWVTNKYDPDDPDEYRIPWDFFGKELWKAENK